MLRRLQSSSLNFLVLGTSVAVFIVAFLLLQGFTHARTPRSTMVLVATRDLQIGDLLAANSVTEKSVFIDEMTALYVAAEDADVITGAFAALPIQAGQPILRSHLVSPQQPRERFAAILSQFPGHSLFPLPLENSNVVAPPIESVQPGDRIGLTIVVRSRPPQQVTPEAETFAYVIPGPAPDELPSPPFSVESETTEDEMRGFPPLAIDLFPGGLQVIRVNGNPQPVGDDASTAFNSYNAPKMLLLLVPNADRERLSLVLQQGDRVFVSLLDHRAAGADTNGFSYWDLENEILEGRDDSGSTK